MFFFNFQQVMTKCIKIKIMILTIYKRKGLLFYL